MSDSTHSAKCTLIMEMDWLVDILINSIDFLTETFFFGYHFLLHKNAFTRTSYVGAVSSLVQSHKQRLSRLIFSVRDQRHVKSPVTKSKPSKEKN